MKIRARVLFLLGTRPEAIKLFPVVEAFRHKSDWDVTVAATAQHRELLDQALGPLGMQPDVDLNLMRPGQSSIEFCSRALPAVAEVIRAADPHLVIVQGDTNTALVGALSAFHEGARVGHVEAGLRSNDPRNPFPEETNRRIVSQIADLHCAPTENNRRNLMAEGVPYGRIAVTGNPIVDALQRVLDLPAVAHPPTDDGGRYRRVLVTLHRRESLGSPLEGICTALAELVSRHADVELVFPVHPNPSVRETVAHVLNGRERIHLMDPVGYVDFVSLMREAYLIVSDSGGVQEEAPTIGTPLLVVRDVTERPEVIECGAARLVGRDPGALLAAATTLLDDKDAYSNMLGKANPYGDGHASERIVQAARDFLESLS